MPAPEASTRIVETLEGVGASVDAEAAVIRGVKLIGSRSKNGRDYPAQVLRDAVPLYEGVRVNVDHPDKPNTPRRVSDRIGLIKSARYVEGNSPGVYGDLHYNPKHSLAGQIGWEAEHNPGALGLSHNASLRMGLKRDGRDQVEAIGAVRSVDLVADPATTQGFFEHEDPETPPETEADDMDFASLTLEQLTAERPDLVAAATAAQESTDELQKLQARVDFFEAQESTRKHAETIEAELTASALDPTDSKHVSEAFRGVLLATESAENRAALIADRVELVEGLTAAPAPAPKPKTTNTTESTTADPADRRKGWQRALAR